MKADTVAGVISDPAVNASEDSAQVLRRARQQAGLSQVELALRAAVAQSMISAYENGHREPSLATLRRLVDATGQRLVVDVVRLHSGDLPDTPRGRLLRGRRAEIHEIAHRHGATNLRVFGSVARGDDGPESDIDIAVDLRHAVSLVGLAALNREIGELLAAVVDVVPARSLRPAVAERLQAEGVPL
jgi:predicted nucleotidyltransferase/DNA-binding XRE family transcriptional regulator